MSATIEIKRNHEPSLPRFAELNAAWIRDLHHMEDSDLEMVANPGKYIENEGQVFTAHIDQLVAGAVALKKHTDGQWELTKMAVDTTFRGQGIGQRLMEVCHDYAQKTLNVDRLFLLSNTGNAAALRLYERNGWVVNHQGPHPIYARCNIGMEKRFTCGDRA